MKRTLVLIISVAFILTLVLTSCSSNSTHTYVIRGEKDIEYNGKTILDKDDIIEMLDLIENKDAVFIEHNEKAVKIVDRLYLQPSFVRIYFFDTLDEAKKAYNINLANGEMLKDDINYRINNMVVVCRDGYFSNVDQDSSRMQDIGNVLKGLQIENEIHKIDETSKLRKIYNYIEEDLLNYYKDNGYDVIYVKNGDIEAHENESGLSYMKDGYVIRKGNDKSYLVIKHFCLDENEVFKGETSNGGNYSTYEEYMKMLKDKSLSKKYFKDNYSYMYYDGESTLLWSENEEWLIQANDVLN